MDEAAHRSKETGYVEALEAKNAALESQVQSLSRQLEWLRRQLFGVKSERRLLEDNPHQPLLDGLARESGPSAAVATETVSYVRRKAKERGEACVTEEGLRFDESVPVETIELSVPASMNAEDYEVIGRKVTHRLAQRPASYVVLRYVRPVLKRRQDAKVLTLPAPDGLWEGAMADVSVVAGVLTDKFCHHLPLYRQHQRLAMSGIRVSRSSLTNWVHRACRLLAPVYDAQLRHVLRSKTLAMDETPIRAGRSKQRGKMNTGWYWPLYGEGDEVVFTFSANRSRAHLDKVLAEFSGTLLTDGAAAYERFARERAELVHAQCWSHTRRMFVKAEEAEPAAVAEALELIGGLYELEAHIRGQALDAQHTLEYRTEHALARVDAFFAWVAGQCHRTELTPSHPLSKALRYAREREGALRVYLTDPTVPIDTNHLERALRPIPMGRKAWLFCWTEVGAHYVGIIQSLVTTCRLHGINPYAYLVDVLQRIALHPDSRVEELTPRRWKTLFVDNPLRSDLELATR
jgi:transposase